MDSFLTPIISAGISALVSYYVTVYTKDREYKNEYYKKVIDKRIAAYEKVEKVLNNLYFTSGENETLRFTIYNELDTYNALAASIADAIKSSMWLSVNSHNFLYAINQNLSDVKKNKDFKDNEQLRQAGIAAYKALSNNKFYLERHLRRDMYKMYDVEGFFASRH